MSWRDAVRAIIKMLEQRKANSEPMKRHDPIEWARADGHRLACQWILDDLTELVKEPDAYYTTRRAMSTLRKWLAL